VKKIFIFDIKDKMELQPTKDIEHLLRKARVVVEWDGTREHLQHIRNNTYKCMEFTALGLMSSVNETIDYLLKKTFVKELDTIILTEVGETVLVLYKSFTVDIYYTQFRVNNNEKNEYEWHDYPRDYMGKSAVFHHIGFYASRLESHDWWFPLYAWLSTQPSCNII
jgi:hypothetical protein